MAAAEQATAASGADVGEGLRRRNVPAQATAVQGQREVDDKKKQAKQVRTPNHNNHIAGALR